MRLALALAAALLGGCTAVYTHPTRSSADFEQDAYACERDSAPIQDGWSRLAMQDRCLKAKGWRPQ